MILEFRTDRDRNGNALYLAIDTEKKTYTTTCKTWVSKEMPVLKRSDRRAIMENLDQNGFERED